jgi:RNA polymerase sigma-70 factor (ECF subfamily)
MDDFTLIERVLAGHKNDYGVLIDRYYKELFKYIYNLTNSYETTEDLLQEVYMKVYKNLHKFNPDKASFRTWLYRISSNHTLNFLKNKSNRMNKYTYEYDDTINSSNENIEKKAVKDERINQIIEVMKRVLKPKHQKIISLHYFSNLTPKEISETTKIPLKTVYKAIKSGIKKIKEEVEDNEI